MRQLVNEAIGSVLNLEAARFPRKRQRNQEAQRRFNLMVSALVCDATHAHLMEPGEWRRISLSKDRLSRRDAGPEFITEQFRTVVKYMSEPPLHWIELEVGNKSPFGANQSTIRAGRLLRQRVEELYLQTGAIGRDLHLMGDPLILRSAKVKGEARDIDVPAGEATEALRRDTMKINEWLAAANIRCRDEYLRRRRLDLSDRWLRRIFNNGSMTQGGRMYGGFWMPMDADERLRELYVNGEPVVGLDFGQCGIRIAYGRLGLTPPHGDLYAVPSLVGHREGVKRVTSAMFFADKPLERKPRDTAKVLARGWDIQYVQQRIMERHAPITTLFYSGFGMTAQFIESNILVQALLALLNSGVVALPVHDCLIVPRSAESLATATMLRVFKEIAGVDGVVDRKALNDEPEEDF